MITGTHINQDSINKANPKAKLNKLQREKLEDAEDVTSREEIMAAGQEDKKKAIKAIDQQEKAKLEKEKTARDEVLNKLDMKKRFYASYKSSLAQGLVQILQSLDWIKGWNADVVITDGSPINIKGKPFSTQDGILLVVCTPKGSVFHQGITISKEPALDYSAIYTLALQVENTMDKARGLLLDGDNKPKDDVVLDKYGKPTVPSGHPDRIVPATS